MIYAARAMHALPIQCRSDLHFVGHHVMLLSSTWSFLMIPKADCLSGFVQKGLSRNFITLNHAFQVRSPTPKLRSMTPISKHQHSCQAKEVSPSLLPEDFPRRLHILCTFDGRELNTECLRGTRCKWRLKSVQFPLLLLFISRCYS